MKLTSAQMILQSGFLSHFSYVYILSLFMSLLHRTFALAPAAPVSMVVPAWMASILLPASVLWDLQDPSASWKLTSVIRIRAWTKGLVWTAWAHTDVYVPWVTLGRTVRWVIFPCPFCTGNYLLFEVFHSRSYCSDARQQTWQVLLFYQFR